MGNVVAWKSLAPHKLIGSCVIGKCDIVGVVVVLMEKVCHCGGEF